MRLVYYDTAHLTLTNIFRHLVVFSKLTICELCKTRNKNFCLNEHVYMLDILNEASRDSSVNDIRNVIYLNVLHTLNRDNIR